ncbi:hypothetical protein EYZ11_002040 [Aspergillus tanneri]|uniref:Uncharacterized protein n=1 Tax=Aspergillus tanneri TaxID=1220188 RepID=A0A4S3JS47_9EURO|nr:hypothetical protein EYZ11_002040 [Aspergillus tanneri]
MKLDTYIKYQVAYFSRFVFTNFINETGWPDGVAWLFFKEDLVLPDS